MKEVVRIAKIVPIGMDLWASLRSPDLLEPAIMPEIKHKRITLFEYLTFNWMSSIKYLQHCFPV